MADKMIVPETVDGGAERVTLGGVVSGIAGVVKLITLDQLTE